MSTPKMVMFNLDFFNNNKYNGTVKSARVTL